MKSIHKRQSLEFKEERLQYAKREAIKRRGKCMSNVYVDSDHPLNWICEFGHPWDASYYSVINKGTWCPHSECVGNKISTSLRTTTIEDLKKFAESKNGKCLSRQYSNQSQKYRWQCEFEHKWTASWTNISQGKWCPDCAGRPKLGLKELVSDAKRVGLEVLDGSYVNNKTHTKFRCKICSHEFLALPGNVRHKKSGCPRCSGHVVTVDDAAALADRRGGKLISKSYSGASFDLDWVCSNGHPFNLSYNKAQQGRWCPSCSGSFGERLVRLVFEEIFKKPFPKKRPNWLSEGSSRLELDGYNEDLRLAFEHQGLQHYKEVSHFGSFDKRKQLDQLKRSLCRRKSVCLIEVPAIPDLISPVDVGKSVIKLLRKNGIKVSKSVEKSVQAIETDCGFDDGRLRQIRTFIASKKGKLLSSIYAGEDGKLLVQCSLGHSPWLVTPSHLKQGTWCPTCAGKLDAKTRYEELEAIITSKDGQLLAKKYAGANGKHKVRCREGHIWYPTAWSLRRGHWCRKCAYDNYQRA